MIKLRSLRLFFIIILITWSSSTFLVEHKEQFNSGSYQVFNVGLQGNF